MMSRTYGSVNQAGGCRRPHHIVGFGGVLGAMVLFGGLNGSGAPLTAQPNKKIAAAHTPLDRAMQLIVQARASYRQVKDYTCTLVKREVVRGEQQPEHVIAMKVRTDPFSVHMRWQTPKLLTGQEACYVTGKNNGMMRVRPPGLLGAVGFVNLDVRDPKATQNTRHVITEAGIGNMIERYAERWEAERKLNRTRVRIGEYEFNKCRCVRVETLHPGSKPGDFYAYRTVIYFDKETQLPIRSESYDWPKDGGKPDGAPLECFSFIDLKLNVELPEDAFKY